MRLRLAHQQHRNTTALKLLQQRADDARAATKGHHHHQIVGGEIHQLFTQALPGLRQHQHLPARLQQLLTQVQRRGIGVTHPDNDNAPCLYHARHRVGKLPGIQGIHPLGQISHLLLIVTRQQRIALHRVAVVRQRHTALAQGTQLIAHVFILLIAQTLKQATHRGFRHPAQLRQLGAVVADQVVEVIENKIRHPLLLRRQ
ncbi:Uncharacterised protein [Enterobacter cloacae]|nr:Uncharacterised protein [Enterobacter cloacae]